MDRITKLCSYLDKCNTFADVACDHGYCAQYMLKNNLCKSAVISDISEKCLSKAEKLLSEYIAAGRCRAVCCDGLEKIGSADCVLIAGIGGEEILSILKNSYIPQSFIFQPMKNADLLRGYLLENNCAVTTDDIFTDGKNYYFIIKGTKDGEKPNYTQAEILYGRDCLKNKIFKDYISIELEKKLSYLKRPMSDFSRQSLEREIQKIREVLENEIDGNI